MKGRTSSATSGPPAAGASRSGGDGDQDRAEDHGGAGEALGGDAAAAGGTDAPGVHAEAAEGLAGDVGDREQRDADGGGDDALGEDEVAGEQRPAGEGAGAQRAGDRGDAAPHRRQHDGEQGDEQQPRHRAEHAGLDAVAEAEAEPGVDPPLHGQQDARAAGGDEVGAGRGAGPAGAGRDAAAAHRCFRVRRGSAPPPGDGGAAEGPRMPGLLARGASAARSPVSRRCPRRCSRSSLQRLPGRQRTARLSLGRSNSSPGGPARASTAHDQRRTPRPLTAPGA